MNMSGSHDQLKFALIGRSLKHSFSAKYFEKKFSELGLDHNYSLLEFEKVSDISRELLMRFKGLNVTIPYKEEIIHLLDDLPLVISHTLYFHSNNFILLLSTIPLLVPGPTLW